MIDHNSETVCSIKELAERLPSGFRLNWKTIYGYARYGIKNEAGDVIKLESKKIGGNRVTSIEAFERFIAKCNLKPKKQSGNGNGKITSKKRKRRTVKK